MENIKTILFHLIQMMQPSNNSQILELVDGSSTTLGWSIKTISHTALEELLKQITYGSLMDNVKMANYMDMFDIFIKVVHVNKENIKMVRV